MTEVLWYGWLKESQSGEGGALTTTKVPWYGRLPSNKRCHAIRMEAEKVTK